MTKFNISVVNDKGSLLFEDEGEGIVGLVVTKEYEPGDRIIIKASEYGIFATVQVDEVLGESLVLLNGEVQYEIPFEKGRFNLPPKAFTGELHYICVREALDAQAYSYRNIALNKCDQRTMVNMYPHACANVETRDESVFFACNAIDGVLENRGHGFWPYASWGINRREDAELTVQFGRKAEISQVALTIRADFPHDNWWTSGELIFSDGTRETVALEKSLKPQIFSFEKRIATWVKLANLIKADDPSPFPALTQIEVFGRYINTDIE